MYAALLQPTTTLDVRGNSTCSVSNCWFLLERMATNMMNLSILMKKFICTPEFEV
jgi:hypothetical protein